MSQGDQDKTEQPTPYRLDEARKRGEVAKSQDVSGSIVLIAFAAIVALTGADTAVALAVATREAIQLAGNVPSLDVAFLGWIAHTYAPVWRAMAPLLLGLLVAAVLGNVLQTGPIFSTHPLKPDFKRMNPAQAINRTFSLRILWELGKHFAKTVLLGAVCAMFIWKARSLAEATAMAVPQRLGNLALASFVKTSVYLLLALAVVAFADLLFTRREYLRKMRMSRRELRDEVKRRDGDPAVKSKQKQQLHDLLKKTRALGRVQEADVVLTNPTHVAVALQYRPSQMLAPIVLAKGAELLSQRIRRLAARHGVPIMQSPPLARALYRECDIDSPIPEARYAELAPIYRSLWAKRQGGAA